MHFDVYSCLLMPLIVSAENISAIEEDYTRNRLVSLASPHHCATIAYRYICSKYISAADVARLSLRRQMWIRRHSTKCWMLASWASSFPVSTPKHRKCAHTYRERISLLPSYYCSSVLVHLFIRRRSAAEYRSSLSSPWTSRSRKGSERRTRTTSLRALHS